MTTAVKAVTKARVAGAVAAGLLAIGVASLLALTVDVTATGDGRSIGLLQFWVTGSSDADIFLQYRLPRVLTAAIVGAGLALAGCTFQAALRNPLAEPYTLGVSSGSSLAAVVAIRIGIDHTALGNAGVGLFALAGAAATVMAVWRLGRVGRAMPPATLLLGGITVAMFCSAASMLIQYTADFADIYRMVHWMMGGLEGASYRDAALTGTALLIGCAVLLSLARPLNALSAGSDAAAAVGVAPERALSLSFFTASFVVAATIAVAGPIGFVGLVVPHALRAIVGPDHRILLPSSLLAGAAMLVLCDGFAGEILAPDQLPVGIVTAVIGGPFFLVLLLREKGSGRLWG